jgi:hypothetical protein
MNSSIFPEKHSEKEFNVNISFGMIVLNGEPYIKYNLRALYPYAHQIIIVEGAAIDASETATLDGHSLDNTLQIIREFKETEDPLGKITLVTAEKEGYSNGFWPGEKDEQSQAYAKRVTGNYLWQIDSDEFYLEEDIQRVIRILTTRPDTTSISFNMITFWGGFKYTTDGWFTMRLQKNEHYFHRIFKWGQGYKYTNHRPPTVTNSENKDLRSINWIKGNDKSLSGIFMYHYSLVFPKQVEEKCKYYGAAKWAKRQQAMTWYNDNYLRLSNPFRVHNVYEYPSWLEYYNGKHPSQINNLIEDIEQGLINMPLRKSEDIDKLLQTSWYKILRFLLKIWEPIDNKINILEMEKRYLQKKICAKFKYFQKKWLQKRCI